jgi:hypothetical protein
MRYLLLSLLVILVFGSCASYQYLTLNSTEITKNDRKEFNWENDTMRLVYNFHGEGGPMTITVYNKTDKPLFVNWKKSAFITDGHATSLFNPNVQVTGQVATTSIRSGIATASYSNLTASFDLPQGTDLIPPVSDISKSLGAIWDARFAVRLDEDSARRQKVTDVYGVTDKFKRFSFEESGSPIQFKCYLTFALGNTSVQEFTVQHSFYVKEVLLTSSDPFYFVLYRPEGDNLYIKKTVN